MLVSIIGVIVVVASASQETYHVAVRTHPSGLQEFKHANFHQIVGFLSAGLVLTSSAVNSLVYSPLGEEEAAAAGFILLSMISVRHSSVLLLSSC